MRDFSNVESAISAIRRGEIVIVLDAEDRENEGDLVCAADSVTPELPMYLRVACTARTFSRRLREQVPYRTVPALRTVQCTGRRTWSTETIVDDPMVFVGR